MRRKMLNLHRSVGFVLAFFLLLFATTGVLLNHSTDLDLEQKHVNWPWLMKQYGMADIVADASFLIDDKVISQFGTQLFVDDLPVTNIQRPLLGGIVLDEILVLATDDALFLISREGEFIERLGGEMGIPAGIQNIGVYHGDPIIQARAGMWRSNFLLDQWESVSLQGVSWSLPFPMPNSVKQDLRSYFYGKGITVQQFLIDVHNGRILGIVGVIIVDVVSLLIVFLALTGLWMWGWRK